MTKDKPAVYQAKSGAIELSVDSSAETIWATQAQIVEVFGVDQSGVARHIKNLFGDGEVDEKSNMQKMHIANSDKPVVVYSLDIILAVGYRISSSKAVAFRKWATQVLRQYITEGYAIDRDRVTQNYQAFLKAVDEVKQLSAGGQVNDHAEMIDLVQAFASTWLSLDAYDRGALPQTGLSKQQVEFTAEELHSALDKLKADLIERGEATDLFAQPKHPGGLQGIVGNVFQTFGGEDLYPTVEEKAAHLLYFVVKNHVFNDGNKRSGAFCFVWFLQKAGILHPDQLTPQALTSLTVLVAESDPKHKDRVTGLVLLLLGS